MNYEKHFHRHGIFDVAGGGGVIRLCRGAKRGGGHGSQPNGAGVLSGGAVQAGAVLPQRCVLRVCELVVKKTHEQIVAFDARIDCRLFGRHERIGVHDAGAVSGNCESAGRKGVSPAA